MREPPTPDGTLPRDLRRQKRVLGASVASPGDVADDDAVRAAEGGGTKKKEKRLLLIRHGCTYMNEYLAQSGCRWGDAGFTDVFPSPPPRDEHGMELYRDSPLSPRGVRQARRLSERVGHLLRGKGEGRPDEDVDMWFEEEDQDVLAELELIAVSPLTRALQTVELGLMSHLEPTRLPGSVEAEVGEGCNGVPIVALPLASERVYLISDIGTDPADLSRRFSYVDFTSEIRPYHPHGDEWWFTLREDGDGDSGDLSDEDTGIVRDEKNSPAPGVLLPPPTLSTYVEWRPSSDGQIYHSSGEPDEHFNSRMVALYDWIDKRPERTIALVCHWGVLQWLSGREFENCEMRVVRFEEMDRGGLMPGKEEEEERLSKVGRDSEEKKAV